MQKEVNLPAISLFDYEYTLPEERIAQFPLENRDEAKLLVYQQGSIIHKQFFNLCDYLEDETLLVLNNTKVIPARLYFQKDMGAIIEIFLLQPEAPSKVINVIMHETESCTWQCMIGNKKRWKEVLSHVLKIGDEELTLTAEIVDSENNYVKLSWNNPLIRFVDILTYLGEMPLPPYIKRKAGKDDEERYQTVYSKNQGAVAAPTAGLHFTDNVLNTLKQKGVALDFLTLHVSAGTFQPIKDKDDILKHPMHSEQVVVTKQNLENLLAYAEKKIYAVGTTSMRSLESLYWFGTKLLLFKEKQPTFFIEKLFPYSVSKEEQPTLSASLKAILAYMNENQMQDLIGETEIFIFPGYEFKVCKGLITNFHLPETTLILLVAAFIGEDWRKVYQIALNNEYRFLSYGDSSLLLPKIGI